jgi:hypothetical protein
MHGIGHAGICRTHLCTLGRIVGTDAFGAPVGVNSMSSADSLIGAARSAIPTVPGYGHALLSNNFVSYLRRPFPKLYGKIVAFCCEDVNQVIDSISMKQKTVTTLISVITILFFLNLREVEL